MKETLKITGMHCKSCEMLIKESLEDLGGVKEIDVSPGKAKIEFDEKTTDIDTIKNAIMKEGFGVKK